MTVPSAEELDSFKYSDLQNLAKSLGLRANLRADKLLKALKAHLNPEARKENKNQGENQTSVFSSDETEIQINSDDQAQKEPVGRVTKRRRRCKTAHGICNSQEDHSEIKISDPTALENQEKQENQDCRTSTKGSLPDQNPRDESAVSSGKSKVNDFKRLHEAHFKKMESIDEYVVRRKKHFKEDNSLYELKLNKKGGLLTPVPPKGRVSIPCTPTSQQTHVFHSTVAYRFSAATKDNEHKRSLTKTPARKSPHVSISGNVSKGQAVLRTPKLKTTERNSAAVVTPFKLTAVVTKTPGSQKKPVFDLKASLSRPLNYEPHKGKLKPWGQSKENNSLNEPVNRVSFHKKTYKQPRVQTREEQRKKHEQERKEKKAKVLGARRGLVTIKAQ
uniref:Nucleolar and spindle associated protein 1 n=1 Tax=Nannospalax galili TaxID=1026970 RepID=A0A8C6QLC4_NANGA